MDRIVRRLLAITFVVLLVALGSAATVAVGSGRLETFGPWASVALFGGFLALLVLSYFVEERTTDAPGRRPLDLPGRRRDPASIGQVDVATAPPRSKKRGAGPSVKRVPDASTLLIGFAFGTLGLGALVAFTGFGIWVVLGVAATLGLVLALDGRPGRRRPPGRDASP